MMSEKTFKKDWETLIERINTLRKSFLVIAFTPTALRILAQLEAIQVQALNLGEEVSSMEEEYEKLIEDYKKQIAALEKELKTIKGAN